MNRKIIVLGLGISLFILPNFLAFQDTEPPVITDVEINPEIQISGGYVNITCAVSDNIEVDTVKLNITYPDNSTYNITMQKMPVSPHYVPSHFYNSSYVMIGTYTFYIWANDTSGNSNISLLYTFNITNDVTPPETYILNGPYGTIYYNDVTFEWVGTDDYTPTSNLLYSYKLEGYDVSWSSWTNQTTKTYFDLPSGSYNFMVKTKDEAGNVDPTPANRSFKVKTDTNPPVISDVEDSPDPQIVGGHVNITCVVTDDFGVDTVRVIIKYPNCCTVNESMDYIPCSGYYYNHTYTVPGIYYYHIWANDTSKNSAKSSTYTFEIKADTNPPVISDVEDSPDPQIVGGHVNITCVVTDDFGVDTVKAIIIYPDSTKINVSMRKIGRNIYFKNMSYTVPGIYYYHIWANDTSKNSAKSSTYTFEIKADTNPPAVIIERPKRFLYIADRPIIPTLIKPIIFGRITIRVFARDYESEIEKVEIYIDGRLRHVATDPPYIWMWNERTFGNHLITAIGYDEAGNSNRHFLEVFIINF
ncbi:MAG TPA: hypothetical protein ENI33_06385 [Thermoplasmatales archaeon]|nr:hypothetical protein [Thermoplasmatales archaeon]